MISLARSKTNEVRAKASVTLPHNMRVKARVRVRLNDGRDAGIFQERGRVLLQGDKLVSDEGVVVEILEANELVSLVKISDPLQLAKACYHLGNRHVQLQIEEGQLRYLHDHVLDDMLRKLGHIVETDESPFNPESGSYGSGQHEHDHHEHGHHAHEH